MRSTKRLVFQGVTFSSRGCHLNRHLDRTTYVKHQEVYPTATTTLSKPSSVYRYIYIYTHTYIYTYLLSILDTICFVQIFVLYYIWELSKSSSSCKAPGLQVLSSIYVFVQGPRLRLHVTIPEPKSLKYLTRGSNVVPFRL